MQKVLALSIRWTSKWISTARASCILIATCNDPAQNVAFEFFQFCDIANVPWLQKEKEDIEEISTELELADEDEPVQYKIGDTFYALPLPTAQKLLETATTEVDDEVTKLEDQLSSMKEDMDSLKAHLYARFGRGINLEGWGWTPTKLLPLRTAKCVG